MLDEKLPPSDDETRTAKFEIEIKSIDTYERKKIADAKHLGEIISAWIKAGFSLALIFVSLALFGFGGYTSWNHKDAKIRENAISLMAVPAGLVAGLLGGIGLR